MTTRRITRRRLLVEGAGLALAGLVVAACGESEGERRGAAAGSATSPEPRTGAQAAPPPGAGAAAAPPANAAAPAPAPAGAAPSDTRLVTEVPEMQPLVQSLKYTNESQKPDQHCETCFHFTPTADGRGRCALFALGQVRSTGWCSSWQAKQGAPPAPPA